MVEGVLDTIFCSYFRESEFIQNGNKFLEFRLEEFKQTDGFQSEIFKGNVYYEDHNGDLKHSKSLIVKTISNRIFNTIIDISFANEIFAYNIILPFFYDLNYSLTKIFPKFYYGNLTFDDAFNGIQILDNLRDEDFRTTNSKTTLDIQHLLLMVKNLGEFHAYSYQAKKIHPEKFFQMAANLKETCSILNYEKKIFVPIFEHFLELLATHEKYREKVEVIRNIIENPLDFIEKVFCTKKEPTAVICHGDFLRNNVLFKYDPENNPIDLKFFDLANFRYCSPITDLGLALYMHSDQETRDQYWDQLIDTYYDALKNTFPENDLVPTKNDILEEFKNTILEPYLIVMFWLPTMIAAEEYLTDSVTLDSDWYTKHFATEHEVPSNVIHQSLLNMLSPSSEALIFNVLTDILNRGFV